MKTLEQIKTEAGNLWPDIEAQISLLDNRIIQLVNGEGDRRQEAIAAQNAEHLKAIAAKDAQLATQDAEAWNTINAVDELTASHAEAIAAKDAQLKAQEDEAWEAIKASANNHAAAITELEAQHAADLAAAVEAEGRAVHNRLDALVQAGQEAHAEGDLDALGKVLVSAYAHTSKARKAKLEADLAAAQAAVAAAADKLAAL